MADVPDKSSAVELQQVSCLYGSFAALRDVSLTIPAGASVLVLGENGAGKSTLLRVIAGLKSPTYGSVSVFGNKPSDVRDRIAYMSHAPMLYDELTALENLQYFAQLHLAEAEAGAKLLDPHRALAEVGLDPSLTRRVGEYSQGMRQRASLARVLLTDPDVLLLDEPFSNLDVTSTNAMIERLRTFLQQSGQDGQQRTLILTTHQAELARPLASITLQMNAGRVITS